MNPMEQTAPSAASPLLAALKHGTREEHLAIERQLRLMDPGVTLDDYRDYLARMLGYCEPLEAALVALPGLGAAVPDLDRRLRSAAAARDLRELGAAAADVAALPRCAELPALGSVARGLGCLYVLEGSTLGGQFIARHLEARLGVGAGRGGSFVRSYGPEVGPMWRAFGAGLEAHCPREPEQRDAVVAAARDTFATLGRWLARGSAR
ncbi:MAG: heme oxygenase [Myxococcaceae bacterium]|nr:heme oxygenase [Myxococcaceae bacterium]